MARDPDRQATAHDLMNQLSTGVAREMLRTLVRSGEDEALAVLVATLGPLPGVDLADHELRAALFDVLEYRISPMIDDAALEAADTEPLSFPARPAAGPS